MPFKRLKTDFNGDIGIGALIIFIAMIMVAGVVIQKHIFIFMGMATSKLGAKDWFYQGFMTFAFWFMTWTILLTSLNPAQI